VLNEKQHEMAAHNEYNFDHPDAFDFELLKTTLQRLKECRMVEVPIYNFVTHRRESRTVSNLIRRYLVREKINSML
jgi:uridine kinase